MTEDSSGAAIVCVSPRDDKSTSASAVAGSICVCVCIVSPHLPLLSILEMVRDGIYRSTSASATAVYACLDMSQPVLASGRLLLPTHVLIKAPV